MPAFNRLFGRRPLQNDPQDDFEVIEAALPFGLKILADGKEPGIDVVAIHGLDGHREYSWTAKNGTLWLRDLLPEKLPNARIITYGYDANTRGQQQLTTQYLHDHATTLINNLILFRDETSTKKRPIIFVAHSLGGILLKEALIQLHLGGHSPDRNAIASSIYGILFFGTPHRGTAKAELGSMVLNLISIFSPTSDALIRYLKTDSEIIRQQLVHFALINQNYDIKFFYESYPTEVAPGIKIMLVHKDSAVPDAANDMVGYGLHKDHVDMVKFPSVDDPDFRAVSQYLLRMAEVVTEKWNTLRTPDMEHGRNITSADRILDSGSRLLSSDQVDFLEPPVTRESTGEVYPTTTAERGQVEVMSFSSDMSSSEENVEEVIQGSGTTTSENYSPEIAREETNVRAGIYSLETGRGSYPLTSAVCHYQIVDVQVGASLVQNYVSVAENIQEVVYVFPLPQDAAVCSFKAVIDEKRTITGVVKEKVAAKQDYNKAVATGRTAALLEKHHADIFQVSLGNIKPRQTICIHISFVAVIAHDSAAESLRLMIPVTIAPRYGSTSPIPPPNRGTTTVYNQNLQVTLSVQMTGPITSITSPTHRIGSMVPADPHDPTKAYLSLKSETFLDKDIVIVVTSQMLDRPRCTVETHGERGTNAYALTLVPRFDLPPLQRQEYIFLVDRSGSMTGQRIQGVRTALQIMLRSLPTQDTSFNIWSFGSSFSSLWPTSRAYSINSMAEATTHVNGFHANYGGTEVGNALKAVFKCANPQHDNTQNLPKAVILLTDGEAWDVDGVISRVRRAVERAKAKKKLLRTFVLGIGDNSSAPMCEGIARAGKGVAAFVGNNENPEGKLMGLLKAARGAVIDDLTVDWGACNDKAEVLDFELVQGEDQGEDCKEPGLNVPAAPINLFGGTSTLTQNQTSLGPGRVVVRLPSPPRIQQAPLTEKLVIPLYPGFRCSIFAIIKRDENGPVPNTVRLTGQVLGRPVVLEVSVTRSTLSPLRDLSDNLEVLHALAARSLIQALEDLPRSDETDAKIIRLATRYSLASCYTSFIAIDEEDGAITPLIPVLSEVPPLPALLNSYSHYPMSPSLFPPSTSFFSHIPGSSQPSTTLNTSFPPPSASSFSPDLGSSQLSNTLNTSLIPPSASSFNPNLGSSQLSTTLNTSFPPSLASLASSFSPNLGSPQLLNTSLLPPSASSFNPDLGSSHPPTTLNRPQSSLSYTSGSSQPSTTLNTPRSSFSHKFGSSQLSTTLKTPLLYPSLFNPTRFSQLSTTVGIEAEMLPFLEDAPHTVLSYSDYPRSAWSPSASSFNHSLGSSQPSTTVNTTARILPVSEDVPRLSVSPPKKDFPSHRLRTALKSSSSSSRQNRATSSLEEHVSQVLHAPSESSIPFPRHHILESGAQATPHPLSARVRALVDTLVAEMSMPTTEDLEHNQASGETSRRTLVGRVSGETSRHVSGELQWAGDRKAPPPLPSKSPSRSPATPLSLSGFASRSPYLSRSQPTTNTRDPVTSPSSRSPRPSSRSPQPTTPPTPESTPNTHRQRRTSELGSAANAIDLPTLAEQTEDSAGSAGGKDKGDNAVPAAPEPPSHPVPTPRCKSSDIQWTAIRLGKGVWPDDFMQAFENTNPLVNKSPPIGHSPTNDASPPSILFHPLKTPKFGEFRSIAPDIDLDLGTPPLSSSPLASRVSHSHNTSVETVMPGRDQDVNPLPDQSRTPSPTATVSPYLSGDAGMMAASSTSLAQPGRRRTSFKLVPKGQTNSSISPASDDRVPYGPISLPSHMKARVSSPTGGSSFSARVPPASRSLTPLVPLHLSSELSPENSGVSRMSLSPHASGKEPNQSISVDSSRPRQNGSRFLSKMRQETRHISFDMAAQDGVVSARRVRYETMVNLGTVNSTSDLTPRDVTGGMYGSAVRYPLVVKQDGESTNYTLGPCIGRGQFGSVYRAFNTATGQTIAVKRINLDGLSEGEVTQLMKEVDVLKSLSHPSIVKYEGMARDHGTLSIVMEYAENGSLGQTLRVYGKLNERLVASYVIKILEGLHYLHKARVVHCDLKAANILTTKNGNIKLSDFAASLNLHATEQLNNWSMKHAGTPNWMAPEVIELKGASTASDIWSLACTIIELLTGKPPYAEISNSMTVMFCIVEDDHPPIPEGIPPIIRDFLMQCFQKDPTKRPTAEMLFEHEWLQHKWGEHKELRPQDSIPFLRRVSADQQKNDSAWGLPSLYLTDPTSSLPRAFAGSSDADTSSAGSHSFVQTVFHQLIVCRVCMQQVKVRRKALFCQACTLVAHSHCAAAAPPACDIEVQALMAQSAAANESVYESHLSTHTPSSPIPVPSPSRGRS